MAATGKVLGTVTSVVGEAKATAADGTVRVLQVGDVVHSDEVITTSAAGAINIALDNGKTLDCGANTDLSLHESILGVATAAAASPAAPGSVEALQQAIASGQDPSQIAPATAAGGAPGAGGPGDGGGGTPVILEQANTSSIVTSGFPTEGGTITFPTPEFELLPTDEEEQPPTVSVSVQVQVQVEVEVDVSIEAGPEVLSGPATGGVFAVSASGDAVSLIEGTMEGAMTIPFVITLSQVFDTDVQVTYQIVPASADNPTDFFDGSLIATITIPAGETSFTVPIQIVRDHFVEGNESFSIVLIDSVNATINPAQSSAAVTIFNDDANPVASPDANWAQEDSSVVASGNVLQSAPHSGAPSGSFADAADTDFEPLTVTNPGTYVGTYGTLVLGANGSYVYTLNNANTEVQALDSGETLTDPFPYSVTDGFNTPDSATLTITLFGSNDTPLIQVRTSSDIFASGAEGTVAEAALSIGSNPSSNGEFVSGSFQVSDTDGVDDIQSVTINGQTVAVGSLVGATFNGSAGTMTVTSFSGGIANFTYELDQPVTDGAGAETDVFTLTASDGTSSSGPATVTITIIDDVPSISVSATQAADTLTVDETVLGTNASTSFADNFSSSSAFGADGAGSVGSAYVLSINAGATGLVDTATGEAVALQMSVGKVQGVISGNVVVFEVSVDASGNVTLDQQRAVMHTPENGPDQSTSLASANLVVLTRTDTITDKDGDSASSSVSIDLGTALNFEDDAPSVNVSATQAADTLTVDETVLATNATANFADNFSGSSAFGADGAGSVGSAYVLSINAGATGLVDTATNQAVTLAVNGSVVEGRVSNGEGGFFVVFTVSVDASANVTLDQQRAVMHTPDSGPDQPTSLASANLVVLTRTDSITDKDGDSASNSASINIGTALTFEDDAPSINVLLADVSTDSLTVDETVLATNATANFADNFSSSSAFGADGEGSVGSAYVLSINAGATGLVDTATNQAVTLAMNGSVVEGRVSNGEDGFFVVFTVSVDASGNVTLDQQRAVMHTPENGPDQSTSLASANLVVLTRTDTITDKDGDSASSSVSIDLGTALNFEDDAPSVNVSATQAADTLTVDETSLAINATANFADDFSGSSTFGADGPGTISDAIYTLSINAGSTGLVDTATGQAVTLQMSAGKVQGVISGNVVVFEVSVDAGGNVTLDQQRAVMHTPDSGPDQSTSLASANLVVLTRTATITDADGDTANSSASINIGTALNFEDDAPSVNVSATQAADTLTVDESVLGTNATANFADNFSSSSAFGADGAGTLNSGAYSLSINAGSTGLVDTATLQDVVLVVNSGVVEGRTATSNELVFTVSVDAGGTVTLDQQRAVMHTPDSGPDQSTSLASANLVVLTRTATITDADGDTANSSASINIGTALNFEDDAPSVNVSATQAADTLAVDESVLGTNATANFADNFSSSSAFGADGAGTLNLAYTLSINAGSTGLVDTATLQNVVLVVNSGVVEGRTATSNELVFTVSVDAGGTVTLDQQRAVMHTPDSGPDQSTSLASANLVVLTRTATITDADGDTANSSASINIGTALNFEDDAPSLDITGGDASVVEGQNITNGTWTSAPGVDAPATTKVVIGETEYDLGTAIDTGKGTLTVNSNGTWTFSAALNQSNPQAVTFTVRITDKDDDSASDSHTITINDGANPGVSGGQVMTVNEAALPDGPNPSSTGEADATTLIFTSGSDAIASIVFGSTAGITVDAGLDETQTITWAVSNGGHTLTGSVGGVPVIQVVLSGATSVAAGGSTGNVTVTATLLTDMRHQNSPDADSLVISGVQIVGQDTDGDTATHTFTGITVLDDAPVSAAPSGTIENDDGETLVGLIQYDMNADDLGTITLNSPTVTSNGSPLVLTSHGSSIVYQVIDTNGDGMQELYARADTDGDGAKDDLVFVLAPNTPADPDGAYTLTMFDVVDLPVPVITTNFSEVTASGPVDKLAVYDDASHTSAHLLVSTPQPATHDVNPSQGFIGIDNNIMNTSETITYEFGTVNVSNLTISHELVNDVSLTIFDTGSGSNAFTWTAFRDGDGQVGTGSITFPNNGQPAAIHVDGGYDTLQFTVTSTSDFKVGGLSYTKLGDPQDVNLAMVFGGADADGDAISGTFNITITSGDGTAESHILQQLLNQP